MHLSRRQIKQQDTRQELLQWLALVASALGFFMVTLDTTIVNVALPSIQHTIEAGITGLQWITAGYTLVFASLLLLTGFLSDRFGSKRIFMLGLLIFTLSSALCGIAQSLAVLLLARLLQGIGAALLVPASLSIITQTYTDTRPRAIALGIWSTIAATAAAAGPVLGGLLVERTGWHMIFLMNIPVGLVGLLLSMCFIKSIRTNAQRAFDIPGQITGILTILSLTFALIEAEPLGWNALPVIGACVVFGAALITFLIVEQRSTSPMLPLTLFRSATFSSTTLVGFLLNFSYYGLLFLLSLFYQQLQGLSAWDTGLHLLPLSIINLFATPISGQMTARTGPRLPMTIGMALSAAGIFAFLFWGTHALLNLASFLAIGFGAALVVPPLTSALLGTVAPRYTGTASGVLNASRQAGGTFGVAILGALFNSINGQAGINVALGAAGVALLLGCMLSLFGVSSPERSS
uniref:MFS transporter n=1 Tax=Thermosporothrix sp. COM3 TaxID=2490863 RepID=A0A455SN12_9CHLR|nr:MFS transporter [Thermosporothrix sp. COM3]